MGVCYYNCDICEEIYCDCGDYSYCEKCETSFCEDCVDKFELEYGKDDELINCPICNKTEVTYHEIRKVMWEKLNCTKEDIKRDILISKNRVIK